MKIAIPVSDGVLATQFGHCERLVLFDVRTDGDHPAATGAHAAASLPGQVSNAFDSRA
jgi:predicted Fe-Mo cluster-binding NifX family protein